MDYFDIKYKDRNPEETIQIIKNFFISLGYEIHIMQNMESEIHTWSNMIKLSMNGKDYMNSCGKGMTNEYALASGYAELYERFCNKMPVLSNLYMMNKIIEISNKKFGYALHPNEIKMSIEEIIKEPLINNYFSDIFTNLEHQKQYLNIICDEQPIGIPYKGFNTNNVKYFDPRVLSKIITSTGMAAGNTIEEALNQGLSEIFERYAFEQLFSNKQKIYHQINIKTIQNKELKEKIDKIKNKYDFFIFDLSYNFKVPVILTVLINKINHNISFNLGSFPVFEIALERAITELYQGTFDFNSNITEVNFQQPFIDENWAISQNLFGSSYLFCTCFPEHVLLQNKIEDYPSDIFLTNKNYSNIELNNYYKQLANKMNINFYYADNSLIDEIKAIHIFSDNFLPLNGYRLTIKKCSNIEKDKMFYNYLLYYNLSQQFPKIKNDNEIEDLINKIFLLEKLISQTKYGDLFLGHTNQYDYFVPYAFESEQKTFSMIMQICSKSNILDISENAVNTFYFNTIKKYLTLISYLNCNKKLNKDIEKILLFIDNTYTEKDFINYNNNLYLIKKIFIEPFQEEINSERFYKICESLIKYSYNK